MIGVSIDKSEISNRNITVDFKKFFTSIGKATVKLSVGAYSDAASELPELASAFGLATSTDDRVVALVLGSLERALATIVAPLVGDDRVDATAIHAASFVGLSEQFSITIDTDFFRQPWSSGVVSTFSVEAARWLDVIGFSQYEVANIIARLPATLARSLHDEWRSKPAYYAELLSQIETPFVEAAVFEESWSNYRNYLISFLSEQVFEESFSLSQIYVEPRCYHSAKLPVEEAAAKFTNAGRHIGDPVKIVKTLTDEISGWLKSPDKELAARIIAGGPGAGKSSYAKILSGRLAKDGKNVLFVPLHQIDLESGISSSINQYFVESGFFKTGPLDKAIGNNPIILILDGLDEIQMQGKAAQESAYDMVNDLLRWIDRVNISSMQIKCLITGRELAVQSAEGLFRTEGQVIYLLPYFLTDTERREFVDSAGLLAIDQRDEWWKRYGTLTGKDYTGIPNALKIGEISDVTAQPLLNYLVSLSYQRGLSLNEGTNINVVYDDLLQAVYNRSWAKHSHPTIRDIPYDSYLRLLEEVALAVWHGAGRTTTLAEVEEHCKRSKVGPLLDALQKSASAGVSSLLLSFYFRQKGRRSSGDKTFEFTHKTFAEYLTALAVVRLIDTLSKQMQAFDDDPDLGIDDEAALHKWLMLCDTAMFDKYLNDFVRREVTNRGKPIAKVWQKALSRMISSAMRTGWPIYRVEGIKQGEQAKRVRNAEEALLACVNACSWVVKEVAPIRWDGATSFGGMIRRLQGQRTGPSNVLAMDCLSYLDLTDQCIDIIDLYDANLANCIFVGVEANYATFLQANLTSCDFTDAQLQGANMSGAQLSRCKIPIDQVFDLRSNRSPSRIIANEDDHKPSSSERSFVSTVKNLSDREAILIDFEGNVITTSAAARYFRDLKSSDAIGRRRRRQPRVIADVGTP